MSKDKYLNTFLPQIEAIVLIILQIFFTTHAVLKIGEYLCDAFRPIALERKYLVNYNGEY